MAAQWKRISGKRREFRSVINSERLNSHILSYFVNNPTSTPALMHMLHRRVLVRVRLCRESRRAAFAVKVKKKKKHFAFLQRKFKRLPTGLSKARHSPEREEALNYKSRSFKQPCRLAASFVWRLQKLIACFHPGQTRLRLLFGSPLTAHNNNIRSLARRQELSVHMEELLQEVQEVTSLRKCHGCHLNF